MGGGLTRLDEWPRHQAGGTFDVVVDGSPHWSDGYYFTTGDDAGAVAFFAGFRLYANTDVLDAFACVTRGGRQRNVRWSRRLRPRIDDLDCGPFAVEIVEPLRRVRLRCAPNRHGVACDLTFDGFAPPYNEERVVTVVNGRLHSDRSNYDQCSVVSGWISLGSAARPGAGLLDRDADAGGGELDAADGVHIEDDDVRIEVDGWTGVRDHSWGIGNHTGGPRSAAIAPPPEPAAPIGLRQWCVFRLPDRAVFWQFHHSAAGELTKFESRCMFPYGDDRPDFAYTGLRHDVTWVEEDGRRVRRLRSATIELDRPDGGVERYAVEALSGPVHLEGGGYWNGFDDGLGRGVYRGDLHHEGEVWDVSHPVRVVEPKGLALRPDGWAQLWGRCTSLDDGATGTGHLECVVIGPYPGFGNGTP